MDNRIFISLAVVGISGLAILAALFYKNESLVFDSTSSSIKVSSEDRSDFLKFTRGDYTTVSGRVLDIDKQSSSIDSAGVSAYLIYLKEQDYQRVIKEYQSIKKCPASFYNSHMNILAILTKSDELRGELNPKTLSRGKAFTLKGSYLEFISGKKGGKGISVPTGAHRYFYLERLSLDK